MDSWYENIGGKMKLLAQIMAILGAVSFTVIGIALIIDDEEMIPLSIAIIILGTLLSWVSSWRIYAIGEIVKNSSITARACYELARNVSNINTSNSIKQSYLSAPAGGWECACGKKDNNGNFCTNCGMAKKELQQQKQ